MKKINPIPSVAFLFTLSLITLLMGCNNSMKAVSVKASPKIADSFESKIVTQDAKPSESTTDKFNLVISKSALDKEFLLQGELIPQTGAAMGRSIRSRIVMFRLRGDHLFLIEAAQGQVVTTELPQSIILAEFNLLPSEDPEKIVFDFNRGMSQLFYGSDSNASDFQAPSTNYENLNIQKSYIQSIEVAKEGRLVIRQVAQIKNSSSIGPIEVRYYLSPYDPNPGYKPLLSARNFTRYGFFETNPTLTTAGTKQIQFLRWNPTTVMTYAISANTPKEYKDAVREGILYWNQVAGDEIIRAVDAPEGLTAPNPDYNIVQWVPYEMAGYAYADMQADPRTGEILHAQVFMTSAFTFSGQTAARNLIRRLRSTEGKGTKPGSPVKIHGFEQEDICDFDPSANLADALDALVKANVDDAKILKAAQDYVRTVVAHEIGHTIGLRHNFAGNLVANYSMSDRMPLFAQYLKDGVAPKDVIPSSSVMDYLPAIEDFIMGDQMLRGAAYSYDQKAIATLYKNGVFKSSEWPLFCTDSGADKFYDCLRFDAGASTLEFSLFSYNSALDNFANSILETYIRNKIPVLGEPLPRVDEVSPGNTTYVIESLLTWRTSLFRQLTAKSGVLKVQRQREIAADFNRDLVRADENQFINQEIKRLGGFDVVLKPLDENFVNRTMARLDYLLQDIYRSGKYGSGIDFAFSNEEVQTIKDNAKIYLDRLSKEFRKQELKYLAGKNVEPKDVVKFSENPVATELASYLAGRADHVLFDTQTQDAVLGEIEIPNPELNKKPEAKPEAKKEDEKKDDEKKVEAPPKTIKKMVYLSKPTFTLEERLLAVNSLDPARSEDAMWGLQERAILKEKYNKMIEDTFGTSIDKLKIEKLPRDIAQWVAEAIKIQSALK